MIERRAPEQFDITPSIRFLSPNGPVIVAGPFVHRHAPTPQAVAQQPFFHRQRVVKKNNFAHRSGILIAIAKKTKGG
jgi:hypothetical protein